MYTYLLMYFSLCVPNFKHLDSKKVLKTRKYSFFTSISFT